MKWNHHKNERLLAYKEQMNVQIKQGNCYHPGKSTFHSFVDNKQLNIENQYQNPTYFKFLLHSGLKPLPVIKQHWIIEQWALCKESDQVKWKLSN